jgi:hypothetical protein
MSKEKKDDPKSIGGSQRKMTLSARDSNRK